MSGLQVFLAESEAPADRRRLQQTHHLSGVKPLSAQIEEFKKHLHQGIFHRQTLIGDAERNPPIIGRGAEGGFNQRAIPGDVRGHDDHI